MSSADAVIVVGVDGSQQSLHALDWAATEAAATAANLIICHVLALDPGVDLRMRAVYEDVRAHGQRVVDSALEHVRAGWPALPATAAVRSGTTAAALAAEAEPNRTVVVGSRGVGAFRGLLLGSVSAQLAAHAPGPVVVVHGSTPVPPAGAPVVVGVDQSGSEAALAFGFDFAARRQRPLVALRAFRLPGPDPWIDRSLGAPSASYRREAIALLDDAVRPWVEKYPGLSVDRLVRYADPAPALLEHSAEAALVVVGSRGHGGFGGLLLGSVSQHVVRHAECPVAVLHG